VFDAAFEGFGYNCATMEANYGWDCAGCSCPGDECTADADCAEGQTCDGYLCADPPEECDALTVAMQDSYGDGWTGNVLTIGDESFTIDAGDSAEGCYTGPSDVVVICDGGSWQSEVSWQILDGDAVLLEGGAPYSGCLGDCSGEVLGCTDPAADNYNPDATADDGTCTYPSDPCEDAGGIISWIADGYCDSSHHHQIRNCHCYYCYHNNHQLSNL
jgi:hypothetical protein